MKGVKLQGIQYAALPYRFVGRRLEILLITSRDTRRWVIPKGWPMAGLTPPEAAATEAVEEAGILGDMEPEPIGSYCYRKRLKDEKTTPVRVIVFPLHVRSHTDDWKEQGQRDLTWFRYQRAASLVGEPSLRRLIREFGRGRSPGLRHMFGEWPLKWGREPAPEQG